MASTRLAKLTQPRSEGLLRRTRLFEALDLARARPVVWIAAPPGAGKTSAVASWLDAQRVRALWYQVDANDADPATFFHYLRIALEGVRAGRGKPLPVFRPEHLVDLPAFARLVFRGLFERMDGGILVLDNFQELPETIQLEPALAAALEEIPEGANVVVISRTGPPGEFARLRAGQKISLLDWAQLKLTQEEVAGISSLVGPAPDEAQVRELFEQTGGWAAGLTLMLERLRQTGRVRKLADTENLDTVFDYFAGQVFNAAPAPHRELLVRLSYLPRMTATLAQAITGDADAAGLLNGLARRNLFTDRRLGDDTSYQFHALFRVFLQSRAREDLGHAEHLRLTNTAAALLQATGQAEDAFALYVGAAEWDAAVRLIVEEAGKLVEQGRRQTLRQWIQALPMDRFEADPWIAYWFAVSLLGTDYPAAAQTLERAFLGFERGADWAGQVLCACRMVDIHHALRVPGVDSVLWIERLDRLLAEPADGQRDAAVYGQGLVMLVQSCLRTLPYSARLGVAAARLQEFLATCDDDDLFVAASARLMLHHLHQGERRKAQALFEASTSVVSRASVKAGTALWWYQPAVQHCMASGDYAEAERLAAAAKALVDDSGCVPDILEFDRLMSGVLSHSLSVPAADRYLREHVVPKLASAARFTRIYTRLLLGVYALHSGDAAEALRQSTEGRALAALDGVFSMGYRYLTVLHAAALSASGRLDEAAGCSGEIAASTDEGFDLEVRAWSRLVEIDLALRTGDAAAAARLTLQQIDYFQRGEYERTLFHASAVYARMYAFALEAGIAPDFCRRMIRQWHYRPPPGTGPHWPWPVRIRALGGFVLEGDAVARKSGGRSASRVLDLLRTIVALGGREVPCATVADTLWEDADGAAAMRNLEVTLHRLRKLLGRDEAVVVRDGRVGLDPLLCWVDVQAFQHWAAQAERTVGDGPEFVAALGQVMALYRGPLLAGETAFPAVLAGREAMRVRWLALVRRGVRIASAANDWPEVARLCRAALTIEPTAEDLLRHLVDGLHRQGDRAEALAAFRAGSEQLRALSGLHPSPETLSVVRAIESP